MVVDDILYELSKKFPYDTFELRPVLTEYDLYMNKRNLDIVLQNIADNDTTRRYIDAVISGVISGVTAKKEHKC